MKKKYFSKIIAFTFIIFFILFNSAVQVYSQPNDSNKKNILIIHSYDEKFIWTSDIMRGINSSINVSNGNYNVYVDYMDLKDNQSNEYINSFYELEKIKYKNIKFDVIICSDDGALDYLLKYRDTLFSKVPVIFCGINYLDKNIVNSKNSYYGITEDISAKEMVNLIPKFQHNLKTVDIFVGSTETGKLTEEQIKEAFTNSGLNLECNYYVDLNVDIVKQIIMKSDKNTAAIFAADPIRDNANNPKYLRTLNDDFFKTTSTPIYSFWDFDINYGSIGGKLISGYSQGEAAGKLAIEKLNGKNIDSIGTDTNKYIFDYNKLMFFKISSKNLPKNSVIINKPFSFFETYKSLVMITLLITFLLLVIIIILVIFSKQKFESEKEIDSNYKELASVCKELASAEEELRSQYEELQYNVKLVRNSEERFRLAVEGSNDAIYEWDIQNDHLFLSEIWTEISGYPVACENKVLGYWRKFIYFPDYKRLKKEFSSVNDFYRSEFRIKTADGEFKWILHKGKVLKDELGNPIKMSGSLTDISERKDYEGKIQNMAFYDSLTNLPNRVLFMKLLKEELYNSSKNDQGGAVFFLDLDEFKNINDTLGHYYGDEVLKIISTRLNSLLEGYGTISRFAGDEFLILIPRITDSKYTIELLNRIMYTFNEPIIFNSISNYVTASIGIAFFPSDGEYAEEILKNADTAMYMAKEDGKNRFCFFNQIMSEKVLRSSTIENNLRDAIKKDELQIYYQPQIDINSRELIGMEALIRWNNGNLGYVMPNDFISIAEKTGLIFDIGTWVFKTVCNQIKVWKDKGYKFSYVAINISPVQIKQPDFLDKISRIINSVDFPTGLIEIEITENVLIDSIEDNLEKINALKKLGIKVALDDFGTGFSSLNYLRILPIDTLKIDKSFIDEIRINKEQKVITDEIIQLSHKLNYSVIAEGVENEEQLNVLKEMHCDIAQGYYFSKPVCSEKMEDILKRNS